MVTLRRRNPSMVDVKCSFCAKSQRQVKKLIAGPGVHICDKCVGLCDEILKVELASGPEEPLRALLERTADAVRGSRPELGAELDAAAEGLS